MSSKKAGKRTHSAAAAAAAPAPKPAAAASLSSDDEDFHDLPKEAPTKKQKKAAYVQQPLLDPDTQLGGKKKKKGAAESAAAGQKGKGGVKADTIPVLGGLAPGDDDEDLDMDGSEDEEGEKEVKVQSKTEAKAARFYDRPAVSAAAILPDPKARTPSHTAPTPSTTAAPASSQLLAPLSSTPTSTLDKTGKSTTRKVIVVLVKASLETVKTKKGYELVSADSHKHVLQKLKKNPSEYRPDILHQCLLTLLDSPLNKAGMLQVFIQTEKNVLVEVHSSIRIPRTFKRFAGLMVQLLHKLKIRSSDSSDMLLKVIRNPVTDHLPIGSLKIGTSVTGDLVDVRELAATVVGPDPTAPVVFCVGSHASGPADVEWTDKSIAISKYPLSASVALGRICNAFEGVWNVL